MPSQDRRRPATPGSTALPATSRRSRTSGRPRASRPSGRAVIRASMRGRTPITPSRIRAASSPSTTSHATALAAGATTPRTSPPSSTASGARTTGREGTVGSSTISSGVPGSSDPRRPRTGTSSPAVAVQRASAAHGAPGAPPGRAGPITIGPSGPAARRTGPTAADTASSRPLAVSTTTRTRRSRPTSASPGRYAGSVASAIAVKEPSGLERSHCSAVSAGSAPSSAAGPALSEPPATGSPATSGASSTVGWACAAPAPASTSTSAIRAACGLIGSRSPRSRGRSSERAPETRRPQAGRRRP